MVVEGARPWEKLVQLRGKMGGTMTAARKRELENDRISLGLQPDSRGRWAIDRVVNYRGTGANREAEVLWMGFDLATGDDWGREWIAERSLTADGRRRVQRREREDTVGDRPRGVRQCGRLAGAEPELKGLP